MTNATSSTSRLLLSRCGVTVVICLLAGIGRVRADNPRDFYEISIGTLPVVISSPHGGGMVPSDLSPRVCDEDGEVCLNDQNTHLIAAAVGDELELLTGARPYQIINRIDRLYIDHNRSNSANPNGNNQAYEDPDGRPYYEHYHGAVRESVDRVLQDHGRGLLIDVHGQSQFDNTVIRGTRNGQSVENLLQINGEGALIGPKSLFGRMEELGYPVTPPNLPLSEEREVFYNGGHILATYGSHRTTGIDSIQIEFSRDYRVSSSGPPVWEQSARDLADAINVFLTTYLTDPALPGDFNGDGEVNAADYSTWRDNLNEETLLPGDTTPGRVTQADLSDWANNYGSTTPALATPEPTSFLLLAGPLVFWTIRFRRVAR